MISRTPRWSRWGPVAIISALSLTACTTADEATRGLEPPAVTTAAQDDRATTSPPASSSATTADSTDGVETPSGATTPVLIRLAGQYEVDIVSERPHDATAYTQGLELHDGQLLESTGLYGESERRWVDPTTGEVLERSQLDDEHFGEGITMVDDTVYQLTWKAERVLIADGDNLAELGFDTYWGPGWGLCAMGNEFVMSDGSSQLTIRSVADFEVIRSVNVTDADGNLVEALNELECVGDQVLANIWGLDVIAVIDPELGTIDAVIDATTLRPANAPKDDLDFAMNGIAYDPETGNYLLTGKLWDTLYEVSLVPA